MALQAIRNNVYEVGAAHPERLLYEDLLPLTDGTTYNAYMVVGKEKSALIDTVPMSKVERLIKNIKDSELSDPDFIIMLRAQEDYAEPLPKLLFNFPNAKIVCSEKLKAAILEQVSINDSYFLTKADGDLLQLGEMSLHFNSLSFEDDQSIQSVYLEEEKVLFSGFIFSAHLSDENVFASFGSEELVATKRYYATQIMPMRKAVEAFVKQWSSQKLNLIAPAHGPVWQDPQFVISLYNAWLHDALKPEIVIAYVSLYKHTRELVEKLLFGLVRKGYSVILRDIAEKPGSLLNESAEVLVDLVQASTLIIASSTAMGEPHPAATYLALLVSMMKPKTAYYGFAGSKVGRSNTAERLGELLRLPDAQRLDDLFIEGKIDRDEQAQIDAYVDALAEKLGSAGRTK